MTVPTIEAQRNSGNGSAESPASVLMPASGISSGDLLIILIGNDGTGDIPNFPTGVWEDNLLFESNPFTGNGFGASWKEADGTENGTSVSVAFSGGAEEWAAKVLHIKNWDNASAPEASNQEGDNTDDLPANGLTLTLTPSWGSDTVDTLWLFFYSSDGTDNTTVTTFPTEFTDNQENYYPGTGAPTIAFASCDDVTATLNPAEVENGMSAQDGHNCAMIAVRGASAGGGGGGTLSMGGVIVHP